MTQGNGQKRLWSFVLLVCVLLEFAVEQVWAWPVPDTGQTQSYAVGDDGYYSINPHSFIDNGDGTVTDNVTHLVWQQKDDGKQRNLMGAKEYCESLTLANTPDGPPDWRLPTQQELVGLLDHDQWDPSIDKKYFFDTQSSWYWSSSIYAYDGAYAWAVNFKYGVSGYGQYMFEGFWVRCVHSGSVIGASGPFYINNSDTATDVGTGLSWQRQDDGSGRDWQTAINYCNEISLDGFSDWRLPTTQELSSIVDYGKNDPGLDPTIFPNTQSNWYWTSTTFAGDSTSAFAITFSDGRLGRGDKTVTFPFARCVRSGPVNESLDSLIISAPSQGGIFIPGTQQTIVWETKGLGGNVLISLSRDGGKTWEAVSGETANSGFFVWTVSGPESVNCVLKVEPITASTKVGFQGLFSIQGNVTVTTTTTTTEAMTTTTSTSTTEPTSTATTLPGSENATLSVINGWSLLSSTANIQAEVVFGDTQKFTSVWKWTDDGKGGKTWAVYLSGGDGGVTYATAKGFMPLTSIASGEGFWVNGKSDEQVQVSGTPAYGELSLTSGWNLVGIKGQSSMAVADLGNATSVWKWTTVKGTKTWAVNLPGSDDKGAAYALSKGFGTFTTVEPGEGFWVNK